MWTRNFRSPKQRFNGTVQVSSFLKHIEIYSISCKQNSNISNLLASRSTADKCRAPQKTVESSTFNSNESK
jgi:hypothetical protein